MHDIVAEALAELTQPRGTKRCCVLWQDGAKTVWQYFTVGTDAERKAEAEAFAAGIAGAKVEAY